MGNPCANWGEPRTNHYPQLQGRQKSRISWWHQRQWWVNITASSSKCSSGWLILKNYSDLPPPFGIIGDANQTNLPLNVTNYSQHVITNLVANYKLFSTYSYNLPLVTQLMLRMSTRTWGIFFYARTLECLSPWMPGDGSIQNHQPEGVCLFCLTCLWNMTCKLLAKPCKSCNGGLTLHQT